MKDRQGKVAKGEQKSVMESKDKRVRPRKRKEEREEKETKRE